MTDKPMQTFTVDLGGAQVSFQAIREMSRAETPREGSRLLRWASPYLNTPQLEAFVAGGHFNVAQIAGAFGYRAKVWLVSEPPKLRTVRIPIPGTRQVLVATGDDREIQPTERYFTIDRGDRFVSIDYVEPAGTLVQKSECTIHRFPANEHFRIAIEEAT